MNVNDIDFEFEEISPKLVKHHWRKLFGNEPMPEILAILVSPEVYQNFKRCWDHLQKTLFGIDNWSDLCAEFEWGRQDIFDFGERITTAVTFRCEENGETSWLIMVLTNSVRQLKDDIRHELIHIHNRDDKKVRAWLEDHQAYPKTWEGGGEMR